VRSLLIQGDLPHAEAEIAELLRGAPNSAIVHGLNGAVQLRRGNYMGATASFNRALEIAPNTFEAIAGLVTLDAINKRFGAAVARVDAALAKEPDGLDLLLLASRTYAQAGQNERAERTLKHAVTIDPRFAIAYGKLAELYLRGNRLDQAR